MDQYLFGEGANTMPVEDVFAYVHNTFGFSKATKDCSYLHHDESWIHYPGVFYTWSLQTSIIHSYPLSTIIATDIYDDCVRRFESPLHPGFGDMLYKEVRLLPRIEA